MSKLPVISGRVCVKALERAGFKIKSRKGSHIRLVKNSPCRGSTPFAMTVVPDHKELDRGTLRAILRQVNIAIDTFLKLL